LSVISSKSMGPQGRGTPLHSTPTQTLEYELTIRRYAEDRGYKFKAGLIEINTGKEILFETEKEIFTFLGLRYVPPPLRNADG